MESNISALYRTATLGEIVGGARAVGVAREPGVHLSVFCCIDFVLYLKKLDFITRLISIPGSDIEKQAIWRGTETISKLHSALQSPMFSRARPHQQYAYKWFKEFRPIFGRLCGSAPSITSRPQGEPFSKKTRRTKVSKPFLCCQGTCCHADAGR
jgi:hypothetical protein